MTNVLDKKYVTVITTIAPRVTGRRWVTHGFIVHSTVLAHGSHMGRPKVPMVHLWPPTT